MVATSELVRRYYCNGYYSNGSCRGSFYSWGRWVLAGIVIAGVLVLLLLFSCIARRRRRRGVQPFYGTGWMAPAGGKWGPNQNSHQMHGYNSGYNANYQQPNAYGANYQPPPAYGQQQPQYTGTTFNPNDGYYGQQNSGVQPPQGTYQRDDPYGPPPNPPPGK